MSQISVSQTKKLEKLTQEQESKLEFYQEKWLKIGLSTEPLDFENAKKCVKLVYQSAGLKEPKFYFRFQSPYACAIGQVIIKEILCGDQITEQVEDQVNEKFWNHVRQKVRDQVLQKVEEKVWDQITEQVEDQVNEKFWNHVNEKVWNQVRQKVKDQVLQKVEEKVWDQITEQVEDQVNEKFWNHVRQKVEEKVWDQITEQVKDQVNEQIYGCHEANWLGFFEFFQKECDLVFIQKLQGLMDLAKYCGWWAPYTNVVFLQDRPCEIHFDAEKRTHADGKMAIKYRDGFGVYVWHGVTMPEKYGSIQSEAWKAKWILTEKNAELRRILIQGIGYGKICRDLNTKKIDSWREYELLRIDDADVEPILLVKMTCPSTGLIHVHRVSPEVTSARAAITLVNQGIDPEEFVMEK